MTDRQDKDRQFKGKMTNGVKPVLAAAARHGGEESGVRSSTEEHRRVRTQVDGGRQLTRRTAWWCDGTDQHVATRRSNGGGRLLATGEVGVAAPLVVLGNMATADGFSS